jgi:hypothetical protein
MIHNEEEEVMEEEEMKKHLLSKAEISILLDTYDDIFSDFDPRPFTFRALSDDFLIEAKKAVRSAKDNDDFDLSFMIPKEKRNFEHESLIRKRLRDHFRKHALMLETEISEIKRNGVFSIIGGLIMLILATVVTSFRAENLFSDLLLVLLEPAGWFFFWIGGEKFVYEKRDKLPELSFYQKMARCEISFHPY